MFEAFSETSKRLIFFARLEAGRLAFDTIEAEHLVLGFIAGDQGLFLDPDTAAELCKKLSITGRRPEPQPTYSDMLLSDKAKQALAAAHSHADGGQVTPLHLLWGVLSNDANPATPCLIEHGVTKERVDAAIRGL